MSGPPDQGWVSQQQGNRPPSRRVWLFVGGGVAFLCLVGVCLLALVGVLALPENGPLRARLAAPTATLTPAPTRTATPRIAPTPTSPFTPTSAPPPTNTPRPVDTSTPVIVSSPTRAPTDTPAPTSTPLPTDTPVRSPTPLVCPIPVGEAFVRLWRSVDYVQQIALCPRREASQSWGAEERFQRGIMLWRQDLNAVYVALYNVSGVLYYDAPTDPDVIYREGEPEAGGYTPPASDLREPVRGFGKVWRLRLDGPNAQIGWATEKERGFNAVVQDFYGGALIKNDKGTIYFLPWGRWAWKEYAGY